MFIISILKLLLNINSLLISPIGYIESVSLNWSRLFSISPIYSLTMNLSILVSLMKECLRVGCLVVK